MWSEISVTDILPVRLVSLEKIKSIAVLLLLVTLVGLFIREMKPRFRRVSVSLSVVSQTRLSLSLSLSHPTAAQQNS